MITLMIALIALGLCCTVLCCLFAYELPIRFAEYDKCREEYRRFFGPHELMNEKKRHYYLAIFFMVLLFLLGTTCIGSAINIYTSHLW